MKLSFIFLVALIGITNAQFRFRNPFSGFRVPSFRRPQAPRAPRVIGQSFSRPSQSFSRPNAIFTVQAPSIPASSSSVSTAPVVNTPVFQTSSLGSSAIRNIPAPSIPVSSSSVSTAPVVNAPVVQTQSVGSSAIREIPAPDMTSVSSGRPSSSSASSSGDTGAFHTWQGRRYLLSWREGRNGFSHGAARSYCRGRGMQIVSLDNPQKAQHFLDLVERNNVPYFWAGGQISSWVLKRYIISKNDQM